VAGVALWIPHWTAEILALLSFAPFCFSVIEHGRIEKAIRANHAWRELKATHLARIHLDWEKIPNRAITANGDHPFDTHLDITGDRSLHQLIDSAISVGGSDRLRNWFLTPIPDFEAIKKRQDLVQELIPLSRFRDRLSLQSELIQKRRSEIHEGDLFTQWLSQQSESSSVWIALIVSVFLCFTSAILILLNGIGLIPSYWIFTMAAYVLFFVILQLRLANMFRDAMAIEGTLTRFGAVFQYLEDQSYKTKPNLKRLLSPFLSPAQKPSAVLKEIGRIVAGASLQKNQLLWFGINLFVPSDIYFAYKLQKCKQKLAKLLPAWLDLWFEIEALCSLAHFAYLNPGCMLPQITIDQKQPVFSATALGHPLIEYKHLVDNDFQISELGKLVIITGSNMSGKSTFLRTIGVNLCLGFAGGPVLASSFQTNLFRIFACIRAGDSLADGVSFFYAEVKRLKRLLNELENEESLPVFYLIDEIFRGTNNRERLIGSQAIIRKIIQYKGVGVLSTHDLELVKLADESAAIHNYHFQEEIVDGQMRFDYRLREGPCPTTNALKIMVLEGLPIELSEDGKAR
jgi:hypothetical protein